MFNLVENDYSSVVLNGKFRLVFALKNWLLHELVVRYHRSHVCWCYARLSKYNGAARKPGIVVPVQKKNGTVETRKSCSLSECQVVTGFSP